MFVTYDLPQLNSTERSLVIRGAKHVKLAGQLLRWEVGEFDAGAGAKSSGVRIEYVDPVTGPAVEIVEVPGHAINIDVHVGSLPEEYEEALKTAA